MKTLILANRGFGDALWTEPVVQVLLDQGHKVNLFLNHPLIYENYPNQNLLLNDCSSLFPLEERPIKLTLWEDPKKHLLEVFLKQAGIAGERNLRYPRLYLSDAEKKRKIPYDYALIHLDPYQGRGYLLGRNVYGIDWEKVVTWVRTKGLVPLQVSGRDAIEVAPKTETSDWREIMSLMLHAKLFIGLDSGPSHIAALMGVPALIFFGSVNPKYRHLDTHQKVFMQNPCPFAHCYHVTKSPCQRVLKDEIPPCTIQDAGKVIEALEKLLHK